MSESVEEVTYVVVGGGIAGVTCAEHLYILHPEAKTVVLTAAGVIKAVTNVLPLTKTLDTFEVEERPKEELENECPSVQVLQDPAVSLHPHTQHIQTASGRCFSYKSLCICTGASPKTFPLPSPHVLYIRDSHTVQQFQSRLKRARRFMVVGNGGIATEMIYEITGVEVVWAVRDKHMTAAFIDPGAAEFLRPELTKDKTTAQAPVKRRKYTVDGHEDGAGVIGGGALGPDWHAGLELGSNPHHNITLETQVEVTQIMEPKEFQQSGKSAISLAAEEGGGSWPVYVELSNGRVYGCDFIVSAIGVTPNTAGLLTGHDFRMASDGGILVDSSMCTSVKQVYAAGDVCTPDWSLAPHWFQMRLWTQARSMGSYAAKSMWAKQVNEEIYMDFSFELFSHATKFFGHKVILLGLFNGQRLGRKYEILLRYTKGQEYVKCIMADGKMQGAVLIGETDMEETFENLILNQMDLSQYGEDLLNPDVDIEDYFD